MTFRQRHATCRGTRHGSQPQALGDDPSMTERASAYSTATPHAFGLSWPLLIGAVSLLAILLGTQSDSVLRDPDTYWHLAAGRWILEHGSVPLSDPFSHTLPGAPWVAHEWLSEVILTGIFQLAGWSGLVVAAALSFAGTLAYLNRFLLARLEPLHALVLTGFAASLLTAHLLARPHIFVWPLLAIWVGALVEAGERERNPPWWLLPLMAIWANLHGSFTLGLALAAVLALEAILSLPAGTRRIAAAYWASFVTLAIAATLITPWGWHGLLYPFQVMNMQYALDWIIEWQSPDFHTTQPLELWLLLIVGLACIGRLRLPWLRLLLLLGLVHLALKHQRHGTVLALVTPFLIATPLARCWQVGNNPSSNADILDRIFLALAAPARRTTRLATLLLAALLIGVVLHSARFAPAADKTPQAALQAALAAQARGPVLNSYGFGGYLIYAGIPVFIDGRADMYGDQLLQRQFEALNLRNSDDLPKLLADYRIGWTLLEPNTPAVALLDRLASWRRIYSDEVAVVHVRDEAAH